MGKSKNKGKREKKKGKGDKGLEKNINKGLTKHAALNEAEGAK